MDDHTRRAPEPEGGPGARTRAFLNGRRTPLRPKKSGEEELSFRATDQRKLFSDVPDQRLEGAGATQLDGMLEAPFAPGFRRHLIREYRRRQQRDIIGPEGKRTRSSTRPEGPSFYSAPAPPPANNWIPIGPSVVRQGQAATKPSTSGRVVSIAVAPGGLRMYAAAANGGIWRSEDGGKSWRSCMDAFDLNPDDPNDKAADSLACGAVALVPGATADTDRIYVGSGEGAGGAYYGVGPIVSIDGGVNWSTEEADPGSPTLEGGGFYALAVDPGDMDCVICGTRDLGGLYRRESNGSGGFHWVQKSLPGAGSSWVTSVVAARAAGATTFYAATWFGPVFASPDGGVWSQVGSGFPTVNVGRIGLAVRPDDPSVVYALVENSSNSHVLGVWRLDTADNTWRQVSGVPATLFGPLTDSAGNPRNGQAWYDLAIAVDPNNVNRIYLGGSIVYTGGDWSGSLYRADVTSSGAAMALTYSMTPTFIGASTHGDIHALVFAPGDSNKLWVGCDGGVFYSANPTGSGNIFEPRNTGLATLTLEHLDQHPTEDAVLFAGSQDNGGLRFTGEEAWLYAFSGDCGCIVVNWNDPYKILGTWTGGTITRVRDGGTRYDPTGDTDVSIPLARGERTRFYSPLVGTPYRPGSPADADIVAFGSVRPWISTTFGGGWQSIPNNTLAGDSLDGLISSLVFASAIKLYAGTEGGGVYRFDKAGAGWTPTRLDTLGGAAALLDGVVTDIAIDTSDPSGNAIYIAFGGTGDYQRVWRFDGTQWEQRSGPAAGSADALLDVQHNAIVVDPANPTHVYVGADIGVWRSTNAGMTWSTFSEGLPDAAVIDLKLHGPRRLLRASTHGRGVFERTLDSGPVAGIELYIRDTTLDQGRFTTLNGLPDPTQQGETVRHWRGPDIKLDTPDSSGEYQMPLGSDIDFLNFVDKLSDDSSGVGTHATATITTRVYVQVHNRGVVPANGVRVMCLLANASAALPPLPPGYDASVRSGTPIATADWETVGITMLDDLRVGFPKIAAFDLTSDLLPPPASLAGNNHHCVLALVHHPDDPYVSTETNTDVNSKAERKAAHKNMTVVEFAGTLPSSPPIVLPLRYSQCRPEGRPCDRHSDRIARLSRACAVTRTQPGAGRQAGELHRRSPHRP